MLFSPSTHFRSAFALTKKTDNYGAVLSRYRIDVERDRCLADTICTALSPENWYMDEDGKASFKKEIIDEGEYESNHEAALSCPTGIIKIRKI